eukprot:4919560-Amphidinium_carterae.1
MDFQFRTPFGCENTALHISNSASKALHSQEEDSILSGADQTFALFSCASLIRWSVAWIRFFCACFTSIFLCFFLLPMLPHQRNPFTATCSLSKAAAKHEEHNADVLERKHGWDGYAGHL